MADDQQIRPSKKQRELLSFIEHFIGEHGYSPSYREIMNGCSYTSVATVALHVNNLIARGHLVKRDRSARSIEVVGIKDGTVSTNQVAPAEEKWFVEKVEHFMRQAEAAGQPDEATIRGLQSLINVLKILDMDAAAAVYTERLNRLKNIVTLS